MGEEGGGIKGGMKRVVFSMCHYCGRSVSEGRARKIRKIKITTREKTRPGIAMVEPFKPLNPLCIELTTCLWPHLQ